jgi:hypothetical protein
MLKCKTEKERPEHIKGTINVVYSRTSVCKIPLNYSS